MALILFNTLTGKKEPFIPLHPPQVTMYNCGPTVYSYAHIGNLRSYVFADILRRTLEYNGYQVKQVINITDVGHLVGDGDEGEDKIESEAKLKKTTVDGIATFYTDAFRKDLHALNIQDPAYFPRATAFINEQIALIQKLEANGYAYRISDGIYFDTSKFKEYGKLGNIDLKGQEAGARVAINPEKRSPHDFALWKFSPKLQSPNEKRLQEWDSPWGVGFPGWSIECSAMASSLLGKTIDIHTGGIDHIPVHHNNEIAQSEGANSVQFVRYWLHNAFISIDGQKISKSIGNVIQLDEIMKKGIDPLAYRYWLLGGSYHTSMNFTWEALTASQSAYERLITAIASLQKSIIGASPESIANDKAPEYADAFAAAIDDDLNTPRALALMWDLLKDNHVSSVRKLALVSDFDRVLGLNLIMKSAEARIKGLTGVQDAALPDAVKILISKRAEARKNKDWQRSDVLRDEIVKAGFTLRDEADGSQSLSKA
jgi:cysteinyl-tRNA synthetase